MFLVLSTVKSPMRETHPESSDAQTHAAANVCTGTRFFIVCFLVWWFLKKAGRLLNARRKDWFVFGFLVYLKIWLDSGRLP